MAQIRPRPAAAPAADREVRRLYGRGTVGVDGHAARSVSAAVDAAAASRPQIAALRAESGRVGFRAAAEQIGRDAVRQAAADAGLPRARGTVAGWVRSGRIPHPSVATLVERRALIARAGGVEAAAAALGASPQTVRRWQSGRIARLTGPRAAALRQLIQDDALARAGIRPGARAHVRIHATLEYRAFGHTSDDYRESRELELPPMDPEESSELAVAVAAGDGATVAALIEETASAWFDRGYDDRTGVHIVEAYAVDIAWH